MEQNLKSLLASFLATLNQWTVMKYILFHIENPIDSQVVQDLFKECNAKFPSNVVFVKGQTVVNLNTKY